MLKVETVSKMSTGHQTNEQGRAALWSADEFPHPAQTQLGYISVLRARVSVRRLRWVLCWSLRKTVGHREHLWRPGGSAVSEAGSWSAWLPPQGAGLRGWPGPASQRLSGSGTSETQATAACLLTPRGSRASLLGSLSSQGPGERQGPAVTSHRCSGSEAPRGRRPGHARLASCRLHRTEAGRCHWASEPWCLRQVLGENKGRSWHACAGLILGSNADEGNNEVIKPRYFPTEVLWRHICPQGLCEDTPS